MGIYQEHIPESAVSLVRYSKIVGYDECAFWGVANDTNIPYACREIWSKAQRDDIAFYLAEAQEEIEEVCGFHLSPKFIVGEQHKNICPVRLDRGKLIALGIRSETVIQAGAMVDHTADPAVITVPTALTSTEGINIYYPGTDYEILANSIEIVGGNLVIEIPRCRMVEWNLRDNPMSGLDYSDASNFQATVDVKLVEVDESSQVSFYELASSCPTCSLTTRDGCGFIKDEELGIIVVNHASYSGGVWTATSCTCRASIHMKVNYYSGMTELSRQAETAIVRLAHSKMPNEPCGCEVATRLWRRDRETPVMLTVDRLQCPFGTNAGAWMAWKFANSMAIASAGFLAGERTLL